MKRSKFSEEQIIGIFKEPQACLSAAELCRKYGVTDPDRFRVCDDNAFLTQSVAKACCTKLRLV